MDGIDIFNQLPLRIDPTTKAVTLSSTHPESTLTPILDDLNKLHRLLLTIEGPQQVPPPPAPVNPKRSVQITKLRESGNASFKKGSFAEAIKLYNLAIKMATDRPSWEASGLVREELSLLYNNRAQSHMSQQQWAEAALDAESSIEMKRVGNVKAWWRRGQSLREMGRLDDAADCVKNALDFERAGPEKGNLGELEALARDITAALNKS